MFRFGGDNNEVTAMMGGWPQLASSERLVCFFILIYLLTKYVLGLTTMSADERLAQTMGYCSCYNDDERWRIRLYM